MAKTTSNFVLEPNLKLKMEKRISDLALSSEAEYIRSLIAKDCEHISVEPKDKKK